jgi:hypothetical protein
MELRLPRCVNNLWPLKKLPDHYLVRGAVHKDALLRSGYLTNISVVITNQPPRIINEMSIAAEAGRRLKLVSTDSEFWPFHVETNGLQMTCPSRDILRIRRALQTP